MSVARGDGVGLEIAGGVVRAVRLRHDHPDRLSHAIELPISIDDEHQALDTLRHARGELGDPGDPTRVALFPTGSTLQRIDVTGTSGPDLSTLRASLLRRRGLDSSMIVDDGPRRWLLVIGWDVAVVRRVEQLVERAGFADVAVEPSPIALARAIPITATVARRTAGRDDGFVTVLARGIPVAAATAEFPGRQHAHADLGSPQLPAAWFDDLVERDVLDDLLARASAAVDIADDPASTTRLELSVGGTAYPPHPEHDVRAPERQIVAVGAAAASSGLSTTARAVDVIAGPDPADRFDRPWVWERMSDLPDVTPGTGPSSVQRAGARLVPRRRRRESKR